MFRNRQQSTVGSIFQSIYESVCKICPAIHGISTSLCNKFQKYSIITKIFIILIIAFVSTTIIHIIFIDDTIIPSSIGSTSSSDTLSTSVILDTKKSSTNKDIPFSKDIESAKQRLSKTKKAIFGYGQNCCTQALKRLCDNALKDKRFDECMTFNQSVLDQNWVKQHENIMKEWRGAGYWLWKPYLINLLLNDDKLLDYGDYLIYMDAGAFPTKSFQDMFEFIETNPEYNGVLFFGVGLPQKQWCKRDAYILQNCDEEKCWNAGQINAFLSIWRKGQFAIDLSKMWLNEASNKSILCDDPSKFGKELDGFRDHRHDQAVITNIMNREGYPYGPSGWQLDNYIVHDRFTF